MTTAFNIPKLSIPEFSAEATHQGQMIRVNLDGNADSRAVAGIGTLFAAIHGEATRLTAQEVVLDLRKLEFMNSSCFKTLVTWLANVQELVPAKQYKIRQLSDPTKHWQKRSLNALIAFAQDLVRVET